MTSNIQIAGPPVDDAPEILTDEALDFIVALTREFRGRIDELLAARERRQASVDAGGMPNFLAETADVRAADWQICDAPPDLHDRRVEITGPTDRKMIINALNSGANVFMADCEDSLTPTWRNVIAGQKNLRDAVNRTITFEASGKRYCLQDDTATLIVRPRGWHLPEKHLLVDGTPVPAALVDFGLYLFHNAAALRKQGTGAYFYLPKLESHEEARLWADVFRFSESAGVVSADSVRVTALIETIFAAFEMDEILYELRDYIVGLNCGRWDYIFSFIRTFRRHPSFVLPDRSEVTMTAHFLRAYSRLLIQTCHRRGAWAIGGMAAQIPVRDDSHANEIALARVRADKEREVLEGHDGTWVAHPGLVSLASAVFAEHMAGTDQRDRRLEDIEIDALDLLQVPRGRITEAGLRDNINVAVRYLAAWLGGQGCVPINDLMEDAATAEIARAQLWQWIHHPTGILDEGQNVTTELFLGLLREETGAIREEIGAEAFDVGEWRPAAALLEEITVADSFEPYLMKLAYERLD
jgi:malate synthase